MLVRSIPACAGEPLGPEFIETFLMSMVYPRVCGGTLFGVHRSAICHSRSIPACAGEPRSSTTPRCCQKVYPRVCGEPESQTTGYSSRKVYPRVCGGTSERVQAASLAVGLSPRVRGNLWRTSLAPGRGGSIPACAGEPGKPASTSKLPRKGSIPACAGEPMPGAGCTLLVLAGLSPRVRGNLCRL